MTTGKNVAAAPRKGTRRPKAVPSLEVYMLVNLWLPFLALDPETATDADLVRAGAHIMGYWVDDQSACELELEKKAGHVRETYQNLRAAVLAGLGLPATDVAVWLDTAVQMVRCRIPAWSADSRVFYPRDASNNPPEKALRAIGAHLIASLFQAPDPIRHHPVVSSAPPMGPQFVGFCARPGCGKLFEKKRADQDFCSKACGGAVRQSRFRAR